MIHSITLNSIPEDGCPIIQMPIHQGYHYLLPRNNPILMHFFTESEMYALPVHFEERIERGGFIFARIRPTYENGCYAKGNGSYYALISDGAAHFGPSVTGALAEGNLVVVPVILPYPCIFYVLRESLPRVISL